MKNLYNSARNVIYSYRSSYGACLWVQSCFFKKSGTIKKACRLYDCARKGQTRELSRKKYMEEDPKMKKMIAMLLALVMVLSFAACAGNNDVQEDVNADQTVENNEPAVNEGEIGEPETEEPETEEPEVEEGVVGEEIVEPASNGALEVLDSIWALYGDEEKFPVMGGNPEGGLMDMPGVWDPAMLENLTYTTQLPAEQLENVTEAATMIHMMNANTFTGAVYGLAEGVDAAAFAQAVRDAVQSAQWMCGFPETLVVAVVDGYVLAAYGLNDAMTPFQTHLTEAYADAEILFSEAIAG